MANNLASFAIHADDVQRCRRFYEAVFGWSFEPWGGPRISTSYTRATRRSLAYRVCCTSAKSRAASAARIASNAALPCDDLDAVTNAIAKHGGRIIMAKSPIPTVGILTKFEDTEGNVLGAMAYEHEPHT